MLAKWGLGPPILHDLRRPQLDMGWGRQSFAPPILRDLKRAWGHSNWTRIGALNDKHDKDLPQKWHRTRSRPLVGGSRISEKLMPDNPGSRSERSPKHEHVSKLTRSPSADRNRNDWALRPGTYPNANSKCCFDRDWRPKFDNSMTQPLRPNRTPGKP